MKFVEKNRTVESHPECLVLLYLQDAHGVPVANTKMKIYAGPPPTGEPPYFEDDDPNNPNRRTDGNGKFQFTVSNTAVKDRLDYWVQVLGNDGTPQSDPVHFPFPGGQGQWVTVVVAPEGSDSGGGDDTPVPDLQLDPRLQSQVGVSIKTANVAAGQKYWKLISAQYQDPDESGGNRSIILYVQDERGVPLPGQKVLQIYPTDRAEGSTDERGHYEFPMSGDSSFAPDRNEHGPYSAAVDGLPGDQVVGMGLPLKRHVQYLLTWRRTVAGIVTTPPPVTTGTVRGKITNASAGTTAVLTSATQTLNAPLAADGTYAFSNVPADDYALKLSSGQIVQAAFKVGSGQTLNFDFTLPPPPPPPGIVRGRISNAPAGARLVLRSAARTLDTLVAPDGTYSFTTVSAGTYALELGTTGVINPNLVVGAGQTVTFDFTVTTTPPPAKKPLKHYLLFGPGTQAGTLTNLILALDYIVHYAPVVGFSVDEAINAERVTIVGDVRAVSAPDEQRLRDGGVKVARLAAADSYALENLFQQLLASGSPFPVA